MEFFLFLIGERRKEKDAAALEAGHTATGVWYWLVVRREQTELCVCVGLEGSPSTDRTEETKERNKTRRRLYVDLLMLIDFTLII